MPRLAIARDFLSDYSSLGKPVQRKIDEVFSKFEAHTFAGLHLEKLNGACDSRTRTIRIDDHYRGIIMAPEIGDVYVLVRVLPHDSANKWIARNRFKINVATGALEVADDLVSFEEVVSNTSQTPRPESRATPIFAGRSRKDFTRLGIDDHLPEILSLITTETELESLTSTLPQGQADALWMLASGYSVESAWAELVAGEERGPMDMHDVGAALERPASKDAFYLPPGIDELREVLRRPLDAWPTPMTNARLIIHALRAGPLTDTQLRLATGIEPHQQVNQICHRLQRRGIIRRVPGHNGILNELTGAGPNLTRPPERREITRGTAVPLPLAAAPSSRPPRQPPWTDDIAVPEGEQNWRLILAAARALTAAGRTPFTRIRVYEWIWDRHSRHNHDRPSLDPTFQGMISNAPGGPRSSCGTPLYKVGRGLYVLRDATDGVRAPNQRGA